MPKTGLIYLFSNDPAQLAGLPEVESMTPCADGEITLHLTSGNEVSAAPDDITILVTSEGVPVMVKIEGEEDRYRLPENMAQLFAWGMQSPQHARAASNLHRAAYVLTLAPTIEAPHFLPASVGQVARELLEVLTYWPEMSEEDRSAAEAAGLPVDSLEESEALTRKDARAALEAISAQRGEGVPTLEDFLNDGPDGEKKKGPSFLA